MQNPAEPIFRAAHMYEHAARQLNGCGDASMLLPSMVNAALSLELYFKCLYILDRGVEFKIKERHSHDFHALFEELTADIKLRLTNDFASNLQTRNMSDVRSIEQSLSIVVPLSLKENLVQWASVFVDLRYVYDFIQRQQGRQRTMMFYPEISGLLRKAILDREPSWQP
jgi:hypothetical protein